MDQFHRAHDRGAHPDSGHLGYRKDLFAPSGRSVQLDALFHCRGKMVDVRDAVQRFAAFGPPLNALVRGTHIGTAHVRDTDIGIDSRMLFAVVSWILSEFATQRTGADVVLHSPRTRFLIVELKVMAGALSVGRHLSRIIRGRTRYQLQPPPEWLQS